MAEKNLDAQIAEKEAEIVKLKTDQAKLKAEAAPKYPKHVRVECKDYDRGALRDADGKYYMVVEVTSEEQEKAALHGKKGATVLPTESVTATDTRAAAAKAAKGGKK